MARWFVLACVLATGCSLALSGPDAKRSRNRPPDCDTGKGLVSIDTITGVGLGISAAAIAGSSNGGSAAVVPALLAAVYFGAALHGNSVVNECRKAMAEYAGTAPAPEAPSEGDGPPIPRLARARIAPTPAAVAPIAQPPPQPQPQPPQQPQAQPQPQPKPAADAGPWADFWKEAP